MTPHACLAQEILEFLETHELETRVPREVTFLVTTDCHVTAVGLVEVLQTRHFRCELETTDEGFWIVNANIECVPRSETMERLCQRFIAAAEEFDCDVDGFRIQPHRWCIESALPCSAATSLPMTNPMRQRGMAENEPSSESIGPIIQELMEMGVDEDELFEELGAISKANPAITRMARMHQAFEVYRDQQYATAFEMFQQLCDETPREQRALLPLMAFCQFHLEEYELAAQFFEAALALREATPDDDAIDRLELTVHLGACLARLGRHNDEAQLYARVLHEDPQHPTAHYNLACYQSRCGEIDLSLMHLREALISDPTLRLRAQEDADLAAIRTTSEFRAMLCLRTSDA